MYTLLTSLRSVFDKLTEAIIVTEVGGHAILYANPAVCYLLGYSYQELIESPSGILINKARDANWSALLAACGAGHTFEGQVPVRRKNGDIFQAQWTVAPYPRSGRVEFLVSVIADLSISQKLATTLAGFDTLVAQGKRQIAEQRAIRHELQSTAAN